MVLVPIIRQIIRTAVGIGTRYYRVEGQAFNKLYRGFPQSRTIGRGVRHGLTGGSIIGSLINPADDSPGNGISQIPFSKQPPTSKPYKTRFRQSIRSRNRCYRNDNNRYSGYKSRPFSRGRM